MNRTPVQSSQIKSVGYDEADHVLEVEFVSGGVYQYRPSGRHPDGVPADVATGLLTADSVGTYFGQHVKTAGFACVKWNPATSSWDAIERRKASAKQVEFLRMLTSKRAAWWGGTAHERIGPAWNPLLNHLQRDDDVGADAPLVETFLASLWQDEASAAIDFLKRRFPE